jgi:PAS domain-containing protein
MPEMTGAEFLRIVKQRFPDTVRLTLSGYTDLKSITDAINEGAVYKFLTKPWDDDLLRANIREAFEQYDLRAENLRLSTELASANAALARRVEDQSQTIDINERVLDISREILDHLPLGVIGVADDGVVAVANDRMHELLGLAPGSLLGSSAGGVLPTELGAVLGGADTAPRQSIALNGRRFTAYFTRLGESSPARGALLVLAPEGEN